MRIDAGLDTGDILQQHELANRAQRHRRNPRPAPRRHRRRTHGRNSARPASRIDSSARRRINAQATLAPILKKEDGLADFSRSASEIFNRIRGFQPWPGAYTKFRGKTLQLCKRARRPTQYRQPSCAPIPDRLLVGCAHNTSLELLELQLEGKKRTSAADFVRGYRPEPRRETGSEAVCVPRSSGACAEFEARRVLSSFSPQPTNLGINASLSRPRRRLRHPAPRRTRILLRLRTPARCRPREPLHSPTTLWPPNSSWASSAGVRASTTTSRPLPRNLSRNSISKFSSPYVWPSINSSGSIASRSAPHSTKVSNSSNAPANAPPPLS